MKRRTFVMPDSWKNPQKFEVVEEGGAVVVENIATMAEAEMMAAKRTEEFGIKFKARKMRVSV